MEARLAQGQAATVPAAQGTGSGSIPLLRGVGLPTAKAERERQNAEALGGLRNPNRAVAKSPKLREVERRARRILEHIGQNSGHRLAIQEVIDKLGGEESHGFPAELVKELRQALRTEFNANASNSKALFDYELWRAVLKAANDPEEEVPNWLEHGCPTGIGDSVIRGCGVFPKMDTSSAAIEGAKVFARMWETQGWRHERRKNYKSFYTCLLYTSDAADE